MRRALEIVESRRMYGVRSLRVPAIAFATALAAAACGGGSGGTSDASSGDGGSSGSGPLHVMSVVPATLTGTSPIVVTFRNDLPSDSTLPTISPDVAGTWVRNENTAT